MNRTVCVFGSSKPKPGEKDYVTAYEVGKEIAQAGFIVCNGGYGGVMEASARGAKEAGGRTIGIVSSSFGARVANPWIEESIDCPTMVDRMLELIRRGDAYVILRGGTGTLLELAAAWEFINKSVIPEKPIVVVGTFWNGVIETLTSELAAEGLGNCTRFVTQVRTPSEGVRQLERRLKK